MSDVWSIIVLLVGIVRLGCNVEKWVDLINIPYSYPHQESRGKTRGVAGEGRLGNSAN